MSYRLPYGSSIPLRYTVSYTPVAGTAVNFEFASSPNITGFVAPLGLNTSAFGTTTIGNVAATLAPHGVKYTAFGTATLTNPTQLIFVQGPLPGGFGVPTLVFAQGISPVGIPASGALGNPFSVVLGYYSPPVGNNIPVAYDGAYSPPTGANVPMDFQNTYVFRQLAPSGIAPAGFGTAKAQNNNLVLPIAGVSITSIAAILHPSYNFSWGITGAASTSSAGTVLRGSPALGKTVTSSPGTVQPVVIQQIDLHTGGFQAPPLGNPSIRNLNTIVSVSGIYPLGVSNAAWVYNYNQGARTWGLTDDVFGTADIWNLIRDVTPQGFDNVVYSGGNQAAKGQFGYPTIYDFNQYAAPVGVPPQTLGRTSISYSTRYVAPGPMSAYGVGPNLVVAGTYPPNWPQTMFLSGVPPDTTFGQPRVSFQNQPVFGSGWQDDHFGQAVVTNMSVGPCFIQYNASQFGNLSAYLPFTQYISVPEIEPKSYAAATTNGAVYGCGAAFIGIPSFNPRFIVLNALINAYDVIDAAANRGNAPDYFGNPGVVNTLRGIQVSPAFVDDAFGQPTAVNLNRTLYLQGVVPPYFGIPTLNVTQYIQPWWGFTDPTEMTPAPTDAYGTPTVGVPPVVITPNAPQYVGGIGFEDDNFGITQIQLFDRSVQCAGWDDTYFFPIAASPPVPVYPVGISGEFGTTWISYVNRNVALQGWLEEEWGVGFSGADTDIVGPMRVYNGQQFINVLGEGIEPYEPIVGLSCGRWFTTHAKVTHG